MQTSRRGDIEMAVGFSQNFGINLRILSAALHSFSKKERISRQELMHLLGVGDNKAEATVTWLGYLGLRDNISGQVTTLGNTLLTFDPYFEDIVTQWIFHYKLASNPEAKVWYLLTNEFLPSRIWFSFNDAIDFLVFKGLGSKNDQHLRSDVSIFLRSFISEDALKKTEHLKTEEQPKKIISKNKFYKNPPLDISPYLIAYIIFDQREQKFPNFATITREELLTLDGNVGKALSLNRKKLEEILKLLSGTQYDQLVDLSPRAGLDQVGFRFKGDSLEILKMYYSKEENV